MDASYSQLLSRVVAAYRHGLADSAQARDWLAKRGVANAALLDRFQLGWSEGQLASLARGEVTKQLQALGLVDADGRERLSDCVIIPAFSAAGDVAQLAAYDAEGKVSWLFPDETPVLWNAAILARECQITIVSDPLAGLVEIARGNEAVAAPAGPDVPLGQGARDTLLAHAPQITFKGCDHLRPELERLGVNFAEPRRAGADRIVDEDANGFTVEFARKLRVIVQGIAQDSPRHLRASVKAFRHGADRPRMHLDTFDIFHARSRIAFAKTAACILGEDPTVMEEHLAKIVTLAEDFLREQDKPAPAVLLTAAEEAEAMELLRIPSSSSESRGISALSGSSARRRTRSPRSWRRSLGNWTIRSPFSSSPAPRQESPRSRRRSQPSSRRRSSCDSRG